MVGIMSSGSREKVAGLIKSAKFTVDVSSKLDLLRQLKAQLSRENSGSLSELLSHLFDLLSDQSAPARKLVTEIVGETGAKHSEFIPEVVPVLMGVLEDDVPAVARQSITCGIGLFRCILVNVAVKGLYSSELGDDLESSWSWMLKFKEKICSLAFQQGSGGVKLLALKFVEAMIILYTPDPNGPSDPPPSEGTSVDFNISWLRGGHPLLDVGDLSIEASQRLGLLLDQLRYPTVKSLSSAAIIVLINSLSGIATKRPAYYGRILPVLLGLDPPSFVIKGVHVYGARRALKIAFIACLKCTHPSAAPWRDRIQAALKEIEAGVVTNKVLGHKDNGIVKEETNDHLSDVKEEVASDNSSDVLQDKVGRKRFGAEDINNLSAHDYSSGKRLRSSPSASEEPNQELNKNVTESKEDTCSAQPTNSRDVDNVHVQQLVSMFGVLVAQGETAVGSLEILISSISADLLAEVVMANMRNLPPNSSQPEGGDELLQNMSIVGSDSQTKYPSSFLSSVLSLSSTFPPIAVLLDCQQSASDDILKTEMEEDNDVAISGSDAVVNASSMTHGAENADLPTVIPICSDMILPGMGKVDVAASSEIPDLSNIDSQIPGLNSSVHNEGLSDVQVASSLVSTDVEDASQEQVTSFSGRSPLNVLPSMSNDRSDELSPKTAVMDSNNIVSSTATSSVSSLPFVLPKMSAPVISLSDEQKDNLQKLVYMRITEAYKQIAAAGGSQVRFSLLAYLGIELPPEIDPWKSLHEHILSDYINHEGHELTLRVLYRLHGEAEEEHDFLSCTTAASVYETFLHIVAETLKDSFPPSDKSLSKLLGEVPCLPKSVLNLLEGLCCPESLDKTERAQQTGDRVTQGLSCVWSLILLRPPFRNDCLKIALQSAIHHLEEVRMKAIRLVANKLYPFASISHQIEEFSKEMLLSVVNIGGTETMDVDGSTTELKKVPDPNAFSESQSRNDSTKDIDVDANPSVSQNMSSISIPEAQRFLSLYFALCTKKHSLFREIFVFYKSAPKEVKQAVNRHIPILVRTMGSSSELLEIIADPPSGSEDLLMQVLHTLTDGTVPSKELLFTIRKLFDTKLKDVEILVPVLPFLSRDEVLQLFPHLVNLPRDKFQAALTRLIQGSTNAVPVLSPAEVLAGIHGIDPERDRIPLKKVTDACNACFEQHQIFTQQVLAKVLNQLVEQTPLPLLFMRTVLQAIGTFPALVDYVMEILSRLVSKQIWKYPKLWVGFLKCAQLTKPQSFAVLLQLPPPQLENALNRIPALKPSLVAHASQPNIQSTLPRSVLVVLGLAPDSQASSQAQTSEAQTVNTGNSEKDTLADKTKESSGTS